MNALELADELDQILETIGLTDNRIPTTLREQQAQIDALKERNKFLESFYNTVKAGSK